MPKHKAVLFDLDGTLLDTLQDIADSVNYGLSQMGLPKHEREVYRQFIGEGREVLVIRALPVHYRDARTVSELIARVNEEYFKRWTNNTRPYQGITNLLDTLTFRDIKLTVLSNKSDDLAKMMVSNILSQWHFEVVLGTVLSMPKKPDPAGALQIARQLGIQPSGFLYLGDTGIDMKTAVGAGMYPIGALWGFRSAEELLASGAKALANHPLDLLQYL